jgi:stress-induced morphogen
MLELAKLRALIEQQFPDAVVEINDLTGTQDHYDVSLASDRFVGLSPVARHRLVYEALGAHMKGDIHALALHTYTLDAWQRR